MKNLLELSDERLVRAIDAIEKYGGYDDDPVFKCFMSNRPNFGRIAWSAHAANIPFNANAELCETGVVQRPLDLDTASNFLSILKRSPIATLRRDDFAMGYMATIDQSPLTILNASNEYREVTSEFTKALGIFLQSHAAEVESICGHKWRVGSIRQFFLKSSVQGGRHLDGWPAGMKKLFILPSGASRELGTTWFRLKNGEELVLHSDKPIWLIFENSGVEHTLVSTETSLRPTIEVDLLTSNVTSPKPFYPGINGWYPWFPTENTFLDGTRIALQLAMSPHQFQPNPQQLISAKSTLNVSSMNSSLPMRALRKLRRILRT